MGRVNKTIDGVFTNIVGTSTEHSSYDIFITMGDMGDTELGGFLEKYRTTINDNKAMFERLAMMEEIIMQMRSIKNISDIKLSLVREYVYARCSFYRKGKTAKDIRIIVDNHEFWDNNSVEKLLKNKLFMFKAHSKLIDAMTKEVGENIRTFKKQNK